MTVLEHQLLILASSLIATEVLSDEGHVSEWEGEVPESPKCKGGKERGPGQLDVDWNWNGDNVPAKLYLQHSLHNDGGGHQPDVATDASIGVTERCREGRWGGEKERWIDVHV